MYGSGNLRYVILTKKIIVYMRIIPIISKGDGIVSGEIYSPAIMDNIRHRLKVWKLDQTVISILNESSIGRCIARHRTGKSRPPEDERDAGSHKNHKDFRPHSAIRREVIKQSVK